MKLSASRVEEYLTRLLGSDVQVLGLESLSDSKIAITAEGDSQGRSLKTYGYGQPVLVHYRLPPLNPPSEGGEEGEEERRAVLRTMAPNPFGFERWADRAAGLLLSYDTFNDLPQHVRALDVGLLTPDFGLRSLGHGGEFFLLTDYVEGEPYARDLQRLRDTPPVTIEDRGSKIEDSPSILDPSATLGTSLPSSIFDSRSSILDPRSSEDGGPDIDLDVRRARCLAEYLARIHAVKHDDPVLYHRRLRDLLGSGEGIMGLTDNYPSDFPLADAAWLERIEHACVSWRWRLRAKTHRLSQVHGDFHPFNVLFDRDTEFWLLDRSRGAWGEPGDDVSCMAANYLFFSLQRSEKMASPFDALWDTFWNTYLELTGDQEVLTVVAPFFAWRALVLASPVWYNVSDEVRRTLFRFIENVLQADVFDPTRINDYISQVVA